MSSDEPRAETGNERTTRIAWRTAMDPTVEISGTPKKVRVLAFEPDEGRTGEWRARQLALNRFASDRQTAPVQRMPTLGVIPTPRRLTSPDEFRSPLPIPFPPRGVETPSLSRSPDRRRVGVEIVTAEPFAPDRVRYFLTLAEQRREVPDRRTLWAFKEAAWTALGRDDPYPFTALELMFDHDGQLRGVVLEGAHFAAGGFAVSPWPDHILAVVWIERDQP